MVVDAHRRVVEDGSQPGKRRRALLESNPEREVVVVEGFFGCMKVNEAALPCVALMGSSLSQEQEELFVGRFRRAVPMFDGDEAGRTTAEGCLVD